VSAPGGSFTLPVQKLVLCTELVRGTHALFYRRGSIVYPPSRFIAQLLPVLVCMGIDGVWIMLEFGVLLLGP
jgi:hypothetical protein